jgi:integrase
MGRKAVEMGALAVKNLSKPGLHFVGGVDGLALQITPSGARSWVFRAMMGGRRREMGLGSYPDVPLADAREKARAARSKVWEGVDPIEQKRAAKSALAATKALDMTFRDGAMQYMENHEKGWSERSHAQWQSSLAAYVFPKIGGMLMRDIEKAHVLQILQPIWTKKTETASRIRGRIEKILAWATVSGMRSGPNPAEWRNQLQLSMAAPAKIRKIEHFKALPYSEMASFMKKLKAMEGQGARALEFTILTAARSGQTRGASWSEIDLERKVWTVPKERMKIKREHRVPLSEAAIPAHRRKAHEQRTGGVPLPPSQPQSDHEDPGCFHQPPASTFSRPSAHDSQLGQGARPGVLLAPQDRKPWSQ